MVILNQDGSVGLVEGSPDLAGSRTAAAMHVAEVLGIPPEEVHPSVGDTDSIGYTAISAGSSVVYKTGWASFEAARDLLRQLEARAALIWDVPVAEVDVADGVFSHRSDPELSLTLKQIAARQNTTGGPLLGRAGGSWGGESPGFAVHIVDVAVTRKPVRPRYSGTQHCRIPAPPSIPLTSKARYKAVPSKASAGP